MSFQRIAVIMAGGSGERFWPLSRKHNPKQLLKLADPVKTLIEQTVDRAAPLVGQENVWVAAAPHLVEPISKALAGQIAPDQILAEPHKRNTAGCMVWLAASLMAKDPNARQKVSMAVIAADHRITPPEGFLRTMDAAMTTAETTGGLVTMGIRPDRPETGYGYIELTDAEPKVLDGVKVNPVKSFREKPELAQAQEFLDSGRFLWNSGSFFWTLDGFLNELEAAAPDLHEAIHQVAELLSVGDEAKACEVFAGLRSISIDFALMEKAKQVYCAEAAFEWDDVGAWDALDRSLPRDEQSNVIQGDVIAVEANENIIVNASEKHMAAILGVTGLTVVITDDAVLVIPKDRAQDVKKIVEALKDRNDARL